MLIFMLLRLELIHTSNTTKNNNIIRFGWLLCCCCCFPSPPTSRIHSFVYSNVFLGDSVGCCVSLLSAAATTVHDNCCIFCNNSTSLTADCCIFFAYFEPQIPPPASRLIVVSSCVVLWASLASILPDGGEMPPRTIVRSLVGSLGGDCDCCSGWIAAADTAADSGGIREGVGGFWWRSGGYLEAAGHGRGGGGLEFRA